MALAMAAVSEVWPLCQDGWFQSFTLLYHGMLVCSIIVVYCFKILKSFAVLLGYQTSSCWTTYQKSLRNVPSPFAPYARTSHTPFGVGGTGLGLGAVPGIPETYVSSFLWAVGAEGRSRHWLPLFTDHFHAPHFSPARIHLK